MLLLVKFSLLFNGKNAGTAEGASRSRPGLAIAARIAGCYMAVKKTLVNFKSRDFP
jgi:hypothetical protein